MAVSYTHLKIHALQIATESSIRSMQEQSKKLVTGKLKEVACQKIDEQTEALVSMIGDNQVDYRFFLGFKLMVTEDVYKRQDKDITKSRRRMGAIVETPSIYVDLTAYENLKEQYKVLGIPSDDGISEILKLVGLENTGNKKAKNFSLGMRQRLGIAVALAGSPDFLVLDEPVNGLDPQGIIEIRELILKLNQEHGITVLISSHILDELSKLATYYGFIDNGKMIKQISSIELESKCRKCTHLKVSSTKTLAYVLDTMNIEYKILSNTEADIFEKVNISKLTTELSKKDCEVISIHEHDESLESYFVSLVGGARHE